MTQPTKLTAAQRDGIARIDAIARPHPEPHLERSGFAPKVKDHELYFTDNGRIVCGRHCGTSARYTYRDLSGQRIKRVMPRAAAKWLADVGSPIDCEDCAAIAERESKKYQPPTLIAYKVESPWHGKDGSHAFTCRSSRCASIT